MRLFVTTVILFICNIFAGIVLIAALNGNLVNHILTPVFQYFSLFSVLWDEKPSGALQFILTKSVVAFAHKDPRSGLNLWTYEFDSITLIIYAIVSLVAAWIIHRFMRSSLTKNAKTGLALGLIGCLLLLLSVSYMTSIEHCSGATWIGFVALYGMGFDEFDLYPLWQWLSASLGIIALSGATFMQHQRS